MYRSLVDDGFPPGYAADDGAASTSTAPSCARWWRRTRARPDTASSLGARRPFRAPSVRLGRVYVMSLRGDVYRLDPRAT